MSEVRRDRNQINATAPVAGSAAAVFDYVCRPGSFVDISGDGSVRGSSFGPERLTEVGQKFGTRMRLVGLPYRITSKVVAYEDGRLVAWRHPLGHHWKWEVRETSPGACEVTETYDIAPSKMRWMIKMLGFMGRQQSNVAESVDNVAAHFASKVV